MVKTIMGKLAYCITGNYVYKNFRAIQKNFGFWFAIKGYMLNVFGGLLWGAVHSPMVMKLYNQQVFRKCDGLFKEIALKYKESDCPVKARSSEKTNAWVLWWQGLEEAPEVVKLCIASQKKMLGDSFEYHILTKDNYRDYVTLPDVVEKYLKQGKITLTFLSDYIRIRLLAVSGGYGLTRRCICRRALQRSFGN